MVAVGGVVSVPPLEFVVSVSEKSSIVTEPALWRPRPTESEAIPEGTTGVVHDACAHDDDDGSFGDCAHHL